MARQKTGLDYFPLDVDIFSDEKIEFVAARFHHQGELFVIKLLCRIYDNGYYITWKDDDRTLFAKRAGEGFTPSLVNDIVQELVRRGFFDKSILDSFGILTSKSIQQIYFEASARRKNVEVRQELLLVDVSEYGNVNIIAQNVNISHPNADILKQSKEEESKEKKTHKVPFDVFWELYDKKKGNRLKLEAKWNSFTRQLQDEIISYVPKYVQLQPVKRFRKDPATFFNQKGWEDEIITDQSTSASAGTAGGYKRFVDPEKNKW